MDPVAFEAYLDDDSRRGEAVSEAACGSAGGAACGDLVAISLRLDGGRAVDVRCEASGCAAARAAAAAAAELLDGADLHESGLLDAAAIATELGGLSPVGAHAAELAAEAAHRALGTAVATATAPILPPPESGDRVLVAVSGGVDSAVAALREREAGAEVIAVTLELWSDPANDGERSCCSADAVRTARAAAQAQGIPHLTVDLRDAFRAGVVEPFLAGYRAGETPNPCVRCNGRVRIAPMVALAERLGAAGLATGHYARLRDDGSGALLTAAADPAKDQTYMLAGLDPTVLARLRFPLGELTKPEVREIAAAAGLAVAAKPESQDLCFLAGVGKAGFLARHGGLADREGEVVDSAGAILGSHRGHHRFTVGQRRGLGIASPEPLYVLATDAATNRVVAGGAAELDTRRVRVRDATLHRPGSRVGAVKLRYRSRPLACRIGAPSGGALSPGRHGRVELELAEPVRAAAPGQTAVLLDGEMVVGHGTIERAPGYGDT
jgi:tRNA-specific 2-thiouridylase